MEYDAYRLSLAVLARHPGQTDTYAYRYALACALQITADRYIIRRSHKLPVLCPCGHPTGR